jgi:hypothetical protein
VEVLVAKLLTNFNTVNLSWAMITPTTLLDGKLHAMVDMLNLMPFAVLTVLRQLIPQLTTLKQILNILLMQLLFPPFLFR